MKKHKMLVIPLQGYQHPTALLFTFGYHIKQILCLEKQFDDLDVFIFVALQPVAQIAYMLEFLLVHGED